MNAITAPTDRLCRPIGAWIAVEPIPEEDGLILQPKRRGIRFRRGTVRRLGREAHGFHEGQIVWYEAHSGHPGQTEPLPADWFGGAEGRWIVLLRAPLKAAPSSEADDMAHDRITAEVERMQRYWGETDEEHIPAEQKHKMLKLKRTLVEIDEGRKAKRRSRRMGHTSDTALRAGIFAVEDNRTPEEHVFYRDNTP